MEDLSIDSETLGFHGWANTDQSFAIVRYIAALQFGTDTTELKPWCKRQMTSYFEEFYTTHLFDSMPAIKELQGGLFRSKITIIHVIFRYKRTFAQIDSNFVAKIRILFFI